MWLIIYLTRAMCTFAYCRDPQWYRELYRHEFLAMRGVLAVLLKVLPRNSVIALELDIVSASIHSHSR